MNSAPDIIETRNGVALLRCGHVVRTPLPVVGFACYQCSLGVNIRFKSLAERESISKRFRRMIRKST
jgi:hypothetical protein